MEHAETSALTAVRHPDSSTAQRWFELLCRAYRAVDTTGDRSITALVSALRTEWTSSSDIETFHRVLEGLSSPWETLGRLVALDSQLPAHYATAVQPQAATSAAPAQVDPAVWHTFFAENGPRWNGTEDAWAPFRTWFLYQADQAGVGSAANGFVAEAESGDKIAVFARHGVRIATAAATDPAAWHRFFAENGPRWNGTEEAWAPFRTWFVYQAEQAGVAAAANGFLTEAEGGDKLAAFARHGVTIAVAAAPAEAAPEVSAAPETPEEPDVAELRWVTAGQIELLDELDEVLGPWETWLSDELDSRMPGWTEMTAETLTARLDDMIPLLVLPAPDALEEMATGVTEKVQELAESDTEVMALLSEMDRDELEQLIEEALAPQN